MEQPLCDAGPEWESAGFPCIYRLRVQGRISEHAHAWFRGMQVAVIEDHDPPQTAIWGEVVDLAQLYGLISRVRDLGMTLISVERIE